MEDVPDLAADFTHRVVGDRPATEPHLAVVGLVEAVEVFCERGLARAVVSDQRDNFALTNREVNAVDRGDGATVSPVGELHAREFEQRVAELGGGAAGCAHARRLVAHVAGFETLDGLGGTERQVFAGPAEFVKCVHQRRRGHAGGFEGVRVGEHLAGGAGAVGPAVFQQDCTVRE